VDPVLPRTLAYEPVYPWITGMAVAQWETLPDRDQTSATVGAQESRREDSLT
jgi:protocatechuate 4,5-dioxygenase beta chain